MATLGKCLLFYLKYAVEMERLYEVEEPKEVDLKGLSDPDGTLKKIVLVGDLACREGADLLEACVKPIEDHFRAISTIERIHSNLENYWELKFRVAPKRSRGRPFRIGVAVDHAPNPPALIPWVGCRGGRRGEDELFRVLKRGKKSSALEGWAGCVLLTTEVKLPIPDRLDEPVASEPLVTQVQQAFTFFNADTIKEIAQAQAALSG
jgi:hypothetical protein